MSEEKKGVRLQSVSLVLILVVVSLAFLRMVAVFLIPLILAALFAGMAYPLYRRLVALTRGRERLAALLTLLVVLTLVVIPVTGFLGIVVDQAAEVTSSVAPVVRDQLQTQDFLERLSERLPEPLRALLPEAEGIRDKLTELAGRIGTFLVTHLAALTRGTASFFLGLFVLLYAMYFFLIGGRETLERILYLLPLTNAQETRLLERFTSVTRATVKGTLVVGVIQGALGGLGFLFVGLSGAAFWGTVMAVLSMIPAVGAALVWVPAVIYLLTVGEIVKGVILLVWSAIVVSSSDNILRPRLVGRDAKMPDLMILVSTLGGLTMFGATGIILGPILAALFLTLWDLYGEAFGQELDEVVMPGEIAKARPGG